MSSFSKLSCLQRACILFTKDKDCPVKSPRLTAPQMALLGRVRCALNGCNASLTRRFIVPLPKDRCSHVVAVNVHIPDSLRFDTWLDVGNGAAQAFGAPVRLFLSGKVFSAFGKELVFIPNDLSNESRFLASRCYELTHGGLFKGPDGETHAQTAAQTGWEAVYRYGDDVDRTVDLTRLFTGKQIAPLSDALDAPDSRPPFFCRIVNGTSHLEQTVPVPKG